jgi:hypothetical protein
LHRHGAVIRELRDRIRARAAQSEFAEKLLEIVQQIEVHFDDPEREQLLAMVEEALDRHVEIREAARRTRDALDRLRSDQHMLLRLFDFLTASPERETIH